MLLGDSACRQFALRLSSARYELLKFSYEVVQDRLQQKSLQALAAIAEVIRGHYHNQELFASFAGAGGLSSLVVVLYCAFGSHRPFQDRCAALYCFQVRPGTNFACSQPTYFTG